MWTLEIFKLHVELTFMIHLIFLLGSTNIYQGTINGYILGCFSLNTFLLASQCFLGFFFNVFKSKKILSCSCCHWRWEKQFGGWKRRDCPDQKFRKWKYFPINHIFKTKVYSLFSHALWGTGSISVSFGGNDFPSIITFYSFLWEAYSKTLLSSCPWIWLHITLFPIILGPPILHPSQIKALLNAFNLEPA